MKITLSKSTSGNALIVVLMTVLVIAIALTSYLALVSNQNQTVRRSMSWNQCIPVCESGIEEALTQLHYCYTNNLSTNGWTIGSDGLYHKTRVFNDGSYYSVGILPTNPPVIYSTGFVIVPLGVTSTTTNYVSRKVRVNTFAPATGGIYAKSTISMNNNSLIDAFDSSNPAYSTTGGQYSAALRETNGAVVLSDSDAANAIDAGTVYGTVITGPNGTATGGPVGTSAWIASGGSGIESPGHDLNDANVQFNDNSPPFQFGTQVTPTGGIYGGTNYTYLLGTGKYNISSISMNGSQGILVNGSAVLYVSNGVSLTSQSYIYINPGCNLQIYLGGNGNFAGQDFCNASGYATNLVIYGLPGCTSLYFGGGAQFTGIINAPEANFQYAGSADFCGSIIANSVSVTGGAGFHCDTSIMAQGVTVASWNEF